MDIHKNARTTAWSRAQIIRQVREFGQSIRAVARAFHITPKTALTWVRRADDRLSDRSSRPHHVPGATPPELVREMERLRRQRWTAVEIAASLQLGRSTVARIVQRLGLARLAALEPVPAVVRYERQRPGDLVHLDVKKLGRIGRTRRPPHHGRPAAPRSGHRVGIRAGRGR